LNVTDMVLTPARERPARINFVRVFAWKPVRTSDRGLCWLTHVWRIECGAPSGPLYTRDVLPIGAVV
jgi:hypothetical protein